jgi:16S rRNA (guanine966-N2)-methyltransferase
MRVIAGRFGGLRLETPSRGVRPTGDRVKESLFAMLGPRLPGARVLDLFAGSGALGLEALSRGAAHAVFVERVPATARILEANLRRCGVGSEEADVVIRSAAAAGATWAAQGRRFDLVFADPPYDQAPGLLADVLAQAPALLAPDGLLVLEHRKQDPPPPLPVGLRQVRERVYGDTVIVWVEPDPVDEDPP